MNFHAFHPEDDLQDHGTRSCLEPFTVIHPVRNLTPPIRLNGKVIQQWRPARVVEWIDPGTGEIVSDTEYRRRFGKPVYRSERALQRTYVLGKLRPEARAFAQYILKFRNLRRGITPPVSTLVKWYADLTGQRAANVRRMVPTLTAARIIESDTLVGTLWQQSGAQAHASSFLQENARAAVAQAVMWMKRRDQRRCNRGDRARPAWLAQRLPPSIILAKSHAL
ncbi:hypothetical protein [Cupriavidus alkaliphilus]|uniref:hypothetical protein n=1 Tax=Cupriavidus alkaliphilus TaxID=942866 RepID=UPI00339D741F